MKITRSKVSPIAPDLIYVEFREFDRFVVAQHFGRQPRLSEVALVAVDLNHSSGSAALHLDRIESRVAAYVERGLATEILGQVRRKAAELGIWTREGGRLVIAGYHQDGPRQVNMQLWNWRGFDVANAHERDPAVSVRGMREAVEAIERGILDPAELITHRYPLERLDEALDATRDRPGNFVKAVVIPD